MILEFLSIILFAWVVSGYDMCLTSSNSLGHCVNIKQCDVLLSLLMHKPLSPEVLDMLKKENCGFEGFEPKVCCEVERSTTAPTTVTRETTTPPPLVVRDHPNLKLLNHDLCGPISEARIFGGSETAVFEFPWMALLGYDTGSEADEFRCGASLINERYVLTAAHCVAALPPDLKLVSVRLGEYDLAKERDCITYDDGVEVSCAERPQIFGIERIHVHPEYSSRALKNDIALVRMDGKANFKPESVRPICLPLGLAGKLEQSKVTVTGWGSTEVGPRSQELLKVQLPVVPHTKCALVYKKHAIRIWYKQLCAGGVDKMDSCSGDSGGPLQALGRYSRSGHLRNIQYGIVSFGSSNCGMKGYPGVYTNVVYYVPWILDTISE